MMLPHTQHLMSNKECWNSQGILAEAWGGDIWGWIGTSALVLRMANLSPTVLGQSPTLLRPTCLEKCVAGVALEALVGG